jgi:hypothetical protein
MLTLLCTDEGNLTALVIHMLRFFMKRSNWGTSTNSEIQFEGGL